MLRLIRRWFGKQEKPSSPAEPLYITPAYITRARARIPAVVFGCIFKGEIKVVVHPDDGHATDWDIPYNLIPPDLRMPNTPLWIKVDDQYEVVEIWRREPKSE